MTHVRPLALALLCLLCVLAARPALSHASGCTDQFTGADSSFWDDAGNWTEVGSPTVHALPGSSDIACWNAAVTVVVKSAATADAIQASGDLEVESGAGLVLHGPDASSVADFTMIQSAGNRGTISGSSTLTVTGNISWNDGFIELPLQQTGGGSFTISGSGGTLIPNASSPITTTSEVDVSNPNFGVGSTFTTTGLLDLQTAASYSGGGAINAGGVETAAGTTALPTHLDVTGTSSALGGSLTVTTIAVTAGASLSIPTGETLATTAAAGGVTPGTIDGTLTGAGAFSGAATVDNGATFSPASATITGFTVNSGGTYTTSSTTVTASSTFNAGATVSTANLTIGGTVNGAASIGVTGNLEWTAGSVFTPISQTGGGTFTIDGSGSPGLGTSVTTTSPVNIENTRFGAGSGKLTTSSKLTLAPGTYPGTDANSLFKAAGVITSGATTFSYGIEVTASATSLTGLLSVTGFTADAGTTTTLPSGAGVSVSGTSTINGTLTGAGTFTGSGTVASTGSLTPATVTLNGNLSVSAGGTLAPTATLSIPAGTLTLPSGGAASTPNLTMTAGVLTTVVGGSSGPATVTVTGNFDWQGGEIGQSGVPIDLNQSGGTFTIDGTGHPSFPAGTISTTAAASITNGNFSPGADASKPPVLKDTQPVSFGPGTYPGSSTSITLAAPGISTTGTTSVPWTLHLTGTTADAWGLGGNLILGTLNEDAGESFTVPAGVTLTTCAASLSGTVSGHGTFAEDGCGLVTVPSGGTLSVDSVTTSAIPDADGVAIQTGGTFTAATGLTITGGSITSAADFTVGSFTMTKGELNGPATMTINGNFDWQGGELSTVGGEAIDIAQSGGTFAIDGTGAAFLGGGVITVAGSANISDFDLCPENITGAPVLAVGGVLTVAPTAYGACPGLTVFAAGYAISGTTSVPWKLVQTPGETTLTNALTAQSLNVEGGEFRDDGTLTAPVTVDSGALYGTGTVSGNLTNQGGTVAGGDGSPGTLTVTGTYTQDAAGTLLAVATGAASSEYSQLSVGGNAAVAGQLMIEPESNYASAAAPGDTLNLLSLTGGSSTLSGSFSRLTASPSLAAGNTFTTASPSAGVSAVVTAPPTSTLTVTVTGAGSGTVSDSGASLVCPGACSETEPTGSSVTLTETPGRTSTFAGWSGDACAGSTARTCQVTLSAAKHVTATFAPRWALAVNLTGTGSGTVTEPTGPISCPQACSTLYADGTKVTLTATAVAGSTFTGWSGGCTGTGPTCQVTLSADTDVTANFDVQASAPAAIPQAPTTGGGAPIPSASGTIGTLAPSTSGTASRPAGVRTTPSPTARKTRPRRRSRHPSRGRRHDRANVHSPSPARGSSRHAVAHRVLRRGLAENR